MTLPPTIQAYFDADAGNDAAALIRLFVQDAIVNDEGHSHAGRGAIEAWWRDVKAKYQPVAEPLDVSEKNGAANVRAKVSGQFPGSPVELNFRFKLAGDLIERLEIGA